MYSESKLVFDTNLQNVKRALFVEVKTPVLPLLNFFFHRRASGHLRNLINKMVPSLFRFLKFIFLIISDQ